MVTTRSTKRPTPPASSPERPAKIAKTPEKPKATTTASTNTTTPKQPLSNITTLLLDIEGTICPITFVKSVLFPHFLSALPSHLESHWSSPALAPYLAAFPPEHATDAATLLAHATDLVSRDIKAPYLKALQGHVWEDGYRSGAYAAPVYPDVLAFLDRWPRAASITTTAAADPNPASSADKAGGATADGAASANGSAREVAAVNGSSDAPRGTEKAPSRSERQVAIYSSGSVPAQQLFLEHVRDPSATAASSSDSDSASTKAPVLDKRPLISDWFDTVNAGPKQEPGSYTTIAKKLDREPGEILFLSDNVSEVKASAEAGMRSIIVERAGNAPLLDQDRKDFDVITTFDHLDLL